MLAEGAGPRHVRGHYYPPAAWSLPPAARPGAALGRFSRPTHSPGRINTMRSSFLYSVLAGLVLTSLGLSSADARHWHHYRHSTYWDAKPRILILHLPFWLRCTWLSLCGVLSNRGRALRTLVPGTHEAR